jgi:hypothetical protein
MFNERRSPETGDRHSSGGKGVDLLGREIAVTGGSAEAGMSISNDKKDVEAEGQAQSYSLP